MAKVWRRKKAAPKPEQPPLPPPTAAAGQGAQTAGPRRTVLPDGTVEEFTCMGRTITVPADPRPRVLDLDADAPGWEGLREYMERRRG
jgi:hypothetical protein